MNNSGHYTHLTLSEGAFEKIFKEHFKGLCFLSQRYVKDFEIAREIVQDTFLLLWEKRETIDTSKSVISYLATAVCNKSLNFLRDNRKFSKDLLIAEHLFPVSVQASSDMLVAQEIQVIIDNAIEELPEKCRQVFILNRFEQMKYHEIADKLQLSVKTVEAQMSKALHHMRIRLADYIQVLLVMMFFLKKF